VRRLALLGLLALGEAGVPTVVLPPIEARPPGRLVALAARLDGNMEIAEAVAREADRSGIDENTIIGVILTENPWLKPDTTNWYGATGLMQVVGRLHGGDYPECGTDLTSVDTNLCYGVRILERKLVASGGDLTRALLFYNGCWGETYREGCETYPTIVSERGEL